ncbi:DUF4214 domain-containing protein [Marivita sp. XM-24bin2]|mgnify:CR=1 FL=1|uniref:DUF4214 domain-containing protein n=1 Tax=unclassified Marivita TaxID=2632480 RepID=UPI000D7A02C3|nr:DUF4214 domain-containing protein [Marivita sp. XM-24bin2]PWL36470.1 MAG: hypothetical protein DCO97_04550 [Marivita sp. XM-24bin2]
MSAGPELVDFQENLSTTTTRLQTVRDDLEGLQQSLDGAAQVAQNYLIFRKILKPLDAALSAGRTVLALSENVAPLSGPSRAVKDVLDLIQPRVVQIKDATDRAQKLEPLLAKFVTVERTLENQIVPAIANADDTLDHVLTGVDEIVFAFNQVSTPNGIPQLNPNAGTSRPGSGDFAGLFTEVDDFVAPVNGLNGTAQDVFDAYDTSKDLLDQLTGVFDIADFSHLSEIFGDLFEFDDLFTGLGEVLEIVNSVLAPLQPLFDAVQAVFDLLVQPVVDFLSDELGINELFDLLAEQLEPLFPDVDLFDGFLSIATELESLLDTLDVNLFELPDFADLSLDVFDTFEETFGTVQESALALLDGIPLRIDSPEGNIVYGTGGDEAIDPSGGNDDVRANAGNDIIVASAGGDTIDGGDGIDRLVFAGELAEYDFTREGYSEDPNAEIRLIFTHTNVGAHGFNEGTEIVTNVEFFDFGTETFTKEQFENAVVGVSVLDADGPTGQRTSDEGELIFLNPGGTLISGLTLNGKTFDNMNVVYGLGGDDRIQGTNGKDLIFGGAGNDLLVPRDGEDALDGGPGTDTFQIFDLGFNSADRINLTEGTAFVRGGTTELFDVENVITQHGGTVWLNGNDDDNVLFTGDGRDLISGKGGDDAIFGNEGRDILMGGLGVDTLRGGDSNDLLLALNTSDNGASETYDGEGGFDSLSYSNSQRDVLDAMGDNENSGAVSAAMVDAGATGPLIVRASEGEIDRIDSNGNVVATDIAIRIENYIGSDTGDTLYGGGTGFNPISINGGGGNDVLYTWGSRGVYGGDGDDLIIAERNPDGGFLGSNFEGGGGTDTLDLRNAADAKFVLLTSSGSGNLRVIIADKDDAGRPRDARGQNINLDGFEEILLGDNNDFVEWGTGGNASIRGADGDDVLRSVSSDGTQSPTFFGDAGNDTIILDNGGSAFGGEGDDRIEVNSSSNQDVHGNSGNDVFVITRMNGTLTGGDGFDTLVIGPEETNGVTANLVDGTAESENSFSSIQLTGINGIESLVTSRVGDTVIGTNDAERISTVAGNDFVNAGGGDDRIFGGSGNDRLFGEAGNDTIHAGQGSDTVNGGNGIDTVDYRFASADGPEGELIASIFAGAVVDLAAGTGGRGGVQDTLISIENVFGTKLNDSITGDSGENILSGDAGSDTLNGAGGDDLLIAGGGGVFGAIDVMNGDAGNDTFLVGSGVFEVDGGTGLDTLDFSVATELADGGGKTLSVIIDLRRETVSRETETSTVVWADDGTQSARQFDGQSIRPEDVLRSDPLYALGSGDAALRLPGKDEDDPDLPSFAIEIETSIVTRPNEPSTVTGIENVVGTAGMDFLTGNDANNTFFGEDGNDVLRGREGDDTLDGGEGRDAAYFDGDQGRYTLTLGPDGPTVTDRTGENGTDTLVDIELLDFETKTTGDLFNLEVFGGLTGLSGNDLEAFIELYIAYFNRAPDAVGLSFWGTAFANGVTLEESAGFFIDQEETRATYPEGLSNSDFATAVYANVLGRVADQEGFDFWVGALNERSVGRDQFILAILGGAKADPPANASQEFIDQQLADRVYLENKTDIGTYFAVTRGMSDVDNAIAVMQTFDGSTDSIDAAIAATDAFYASAIDADDGEFLLQIVGVIDNPFA